MCDLKGPMYGASYGSFSRNVVWVRVQILKKKNLNKRSNENRAFYTGRLFLVLQGSTGTKILKLFCIYLFLMWD